MSFDAAGEVQLGQDPYEDPYQELLEVSHDATSALACIFDKLHL